MVNIGSSITAHLLDDEGPEDVHDAPLRRSTAATFRRLSDEFEEQCCLRLQFLSRLDKHSVLHNQIRLLCFKL